MGLILDDKKYLSAGDDTRWYFHLWLYSDPTTNYECQATLQRRVDGQWQMTDEIYFREFERDKFNDRYYVNFRRKFASDVDYRAQWVSQ